MVLQGIDQETMKLYNIKMEKVGMDFYIYFGKLCIGMFNYIIEQDLGTYKFKSDNGCIIIWKNRFLYSVTIY